LSAFSGKISIQKSYIQPVWLYADYKFTCNMAALCESKLKVPSSSVNLLDSWTLTWYIGAILRTIYPPNHCLGWVLRLRRPANKRDFHRTKWLDISPEKSDFHVLGTFAKMTSLILISIVSIVLYLFKYGSFVSSHILHILSHILPPRVYKEIPNGRVW